MFQIADNGIIKLSRGDNVEMPLFINRGTKLVPIRYDLRDNSDTEVYFGLMLPGQQFESALLRKKYTKEDSNEHGDVVIKFTPEDTIYLDPGKYFYEIKAILQNGDINTIISKTEFYII